MGGQDLDLQPDPSSNEAIGAFVAMMVVLLFFVYFCCVPIYHGYKKRKEREQELLNTDQRWNTDRFFCQRQWPKNYRQDKKYSKLAACSSRNSSVRSRLTEVDALETGADTDLFQEQQRQPEDLLNAESSAASTKSTIVTVESETNSGSNSDEHLNNGRGGGPADDDEEVSSYEPSEDDATEYDELFREAKDRE